MAVLEKSPPQGQPGRTLHDRVNVMESTTSYGWCRICKVTGCPRPSRHRDARSAASAVRTGSSAVAAGQAFRTVCGVSPRHTVWGRKRVPDGRPRMRPLHDRGVPGTLAPGALAGPPPCRDATPLGTGRRRRWAAVSGADSVDVERSVEGHEVVGGAPVPLDHEKGGVVGGAPAPFPPQRVGESAQIRPHSL